MVGASTTLVAAGADETLAARSSLSERPGARASIEAYIDAGNRMLIVMDLTWKACVVLFVVVVAAWALGTLPGAVRLV